MAVIVPHRFLNRLVPDHNILFIRYLLIGTFNPGPPCENLLTDLEKREVRSIIESKQYKNISSVRNFYDRPSNRMWGTMDRLHKPSLYSMHGNKFRNINGLKYFKKLERDDVYLRQQAFCEEQGIFISDMIRSIKPKELAKIYSQFKDTERL
jgi:hypothetical protein